MYYVSHPYRLQVNLVSEDIISREFYPIVLLNHDDERRMKKAVQVELSTILGLCSRTAYCHSLRICHSQVWPRAGTRSVYV